MRIDGYLPSYSPDRGPRSGTAVTPYREAQREVEAQREQPAAPASSQAPQIRRVQASSSNTDSLPTRSQDLGYQQPTLSNRAAQALASYSTTAAYASEYDAQEVLGLDLYA